MDTEYNRLDIAKRFLRTIICIIAFELVRTLTYATTFVLYIFLLISGKPSKTLQDFGNKLSCYAHSLLRYMTLNSNIRPFPFSDLPTDKDCKPSPSHINFS